MIRGGTAFRRPTSGKRTGSGLQHSPPPPRNVIPNSKMHGTAIALAAAFGAVALFGTANAGSVSLNDANFEAEVFDSEKNAFVNFNAPW